MFCTRCGNQLRDGDLFCGKCGARVDNGVQDSPPSAPLPSVPGPETPKVPDPIPGLKPGLKLPPKRLVRRTQQAVEPKSLVVNGSCRWCGKKLDALATVCPACGARSEAQVVFDNAPVTRADVIRAGEIGKDLGANSAAGTAVELGLYQGCTGDGCMGILFLPFVLLNPLFWMQWAYKSKVKEALMRGDLTLAEEYKATSTKFAVAGWVVIGIVAIALWVLSNGME